MMLIYIVILSGFVVWTAVNSLFLPSLPKKPALKKTPAVSVLVPLRNEERNVETIITALKRSNYPEMEVLLLNDGSEDRTDELLRAFTAGDPRFSVLQGKPLPRNWVGKVHACHQLQQAAKGDYLLFIDADISFAPDAISQSVSMAQERRAALLTGFPAFQVPPFLSKLLVPMLHFVIYFHLPLSLANYSRYPQAAAANGMWMLFERGAYDRIGGHAAVKHSLVEDVHLALTLKRAGERVVLANITKAVSCKMYETNRDVWEGFLKNSFTGIGRSSFLAIALAVFYSVFYIAPLFLAIAGLWSGQWLWLAPYGLTVLQQAFIMFSSQQRWRLAWLMPLQAAAMIAVMLRAMWKHFNKQPYRWKGRDYS